MSASAGSQGQIPPVIHAVMPEGWVRLRPGDDFERQIHQLAAHLVLSVDQSRRDIARLQTRRLLSELGEKADGRVYEYWIPVGPTGQVLIPATITVGPLPHQPDPARSPADVLLGLSSASPGARAVEVSGRLAVRTTADIDGEQDEEGRYTSFPRRRVSVIVSPADARGEWLVFLAEIIVPATDEAHDVVAATEFFVDAMLTAVRLDDDATPKRADQEGA